MTSVFPRLSFASDQTAPDGTRKLLWRLSDGETIESVLIPRKMSDGHFRTTACISSQVGCAMACDFCLTGKQGLKRNLTREEIIAQVWELKQLSSVHNIVFMGMGEPLHNFENVVGACEFFLAPHGFQFSRRRITISTSGLVPQIRKLGQRIGVSLAVSLNGSNDESRTAVMPINRKWNIEALLTACREYPVTRSRPIMFEYVLLAEVNDSLEDARQVFELLAAQVGLDRCKVNLIPFNPHPGSPYRRPSDSQIKQFQHALISRGLSTTVRKSRGPEISAACGQLSSALGSSPAQITP